VKISNMGSRSNVKAASCRPNAQLTFWDLACAQLEQFSAGQRRPISTSLLKSLWKRRHGSGLRFGIAMVFYSLHYS
jgi:hypothetical protein